MEDFQNIQWFPGHMTKSFRMIKENLKLVNCIVELLDARLPISSKNPNLDSLIENKIRIIVLNKEDLADKSKTNKFLQYYKSKGFFATSFNSKLSSSGNQIINLAKSALKEKIEKKKQKGYENYKIKMMVLGIPNVGKSSFINKLCSEKITKVQNKPGVTRGKQWVNLDKNIELLDTPGVLWPKFEDKAVSEKLAFIGSIKDQILDIEHLALKFVEFLINNQEEVLLKFYSITKEELINLSSYDILKKMSKNKGMLLKGGLEDTERLSINILNNFRSGKLGKITLDNI